MHVIRRAIPLALMFVAVASAGASAQGQKIGFIRSSVLLDQAPGRAEAEAQFDKETAGYRDQIKRMTDSLDAMVASFQKVQGSMTA
jgi:Skp family chaperone for outer membrane proteins